MRTRSVLVVASVVFLLVLGASACSSNKPSAAPAADKATFCAINTRLDKAGADVSSEAGFLRVLKAHKTDLRNLDNDAPAGKIGTETHTLVAAADAAVASGNVNSLNKPTLDTAGADIDTYCGTDGNGNRLPAYFAAGKGSSLCSANDAIDQGTQTATSATDILTFLAGHQSLITQFSAGITSLPASVKGDAQTLVSAAQSAVASNNATALGSTAVSNASATMDLYCGVNH